MPSGNEPLPDQCWPSFLPQNGMTRPQWVNWLAVMQLNCINYPSISSLHGGINVQYVHFQTTMERGSPGSEDYFTVSTHSSNGCQPFLGHKGTGSGLWKTLGHSHRSHQSTIHCDWGNPYLYLDQSITKKWCHTMWPSKLAFTKSHCAFYLCSKNKLLCWSAYWCVFHVFGTLSMYH